MTRILAALTITFLLSGTVTSQNKTDLASEGLKGSVHTVSTESSESGRTKKMDALAFNPKAQLVERTIYNDYGDLVGTETYSHDAAGQLIVAEMYEPKGRMREKRVFIYRQNKLAEVITHDGSGVAQLKQEYIHDRHGRVKEEIYSFKAKPVGKTSFELDRNGNIVEAAFFQPNGAKAVAPLGPCFSAHRVVYSYDRHGRVSEEITYEPEGSVKRKSSYRYDHKGNIAEELRVDTYSTLKFVHSYDYDTRGNWTKQTILVHDSGVPLIGDRPDVSERRIVKTRRITYY